MKLQKTLKQVRQEKGMQQTTAAKLIGISQTYLSQIENGHKGMSIDVLEKVAKAYKIPIAMLILRSLDESDVPAQKIEVFRNMKPALVNLIKSVWG